MRPHHHPAPQAPSRSHVEVITIGSRGKRRSLRSIDVPRSRAPRFDRCECRPGDPLYNTPHSHPRLR